MRETDTRTTPPGRRPPAYLGNYAVNVTPPHLRPAGEAAQLLAQAWRAYVAEYGYDEEGFVDLAVRSLPNYGHDQAPTVKSWYRERLQLATDGWEY